MPSHRFFLHHIMPNIPLILKYHLSFLNAVSCSTTQCQLIFFTTNPLNGAVMSERFGLNFPTYFAKSISVEHHSYAQASVSPLYFLFFLYILFNTIWMSAYDQVTLIFCFESTLIYVHHYPNLHRISLWLCSSYFYPKNKASWYSKTNFYSIKSLGDSFVENHLCRMHFWWQSSELISSNWCIERYGSYTLYSLSRICQ